MAKNIFEMAPGWDELKQARYFVLLCVLLSVVFFSPLVKIGSAGSFLLSIMFTGVIVAAVYAASSGAKIEFKVALLLATVWLVITWADIEQYSGTGNLISGTILVGLNIFAFATILLHITRAERIDFNLLCGGTALYLLIGLNWAVTYMLLEELNPGTFKIQTGELAWPNFLYFSLTTLTTLGYGDVLPLKPFARIWSVLEAVTGVLYIAVLVARLISLYRR